MVWSRSSAGSACLSPAARPSGSTAVRRVAALPSFASMLSGEVVEVRGSEDIGGVDDLVKPIEDRPPVARDTDPEVAGLAELADELLRPVLGASEQHRAAHATGEVGDHGRLLGVVHHHHVMGHRADRCFDRIH